ncbi:MAG: ferric reductase-like transmembrane domain-containing protein [Candidatus Promineifilaceae bacterium]
MKTFDRKQVLAIGTHALCLLPLIIVFSSAILTLFGAGTTLSFVASAGILTNAALLAFTAMLAMTPISIVSGWRWPQGRKRPLALYAFAYSMIHFLIFSGGFGFAPLLTLSSTFSTAMLATGSIALIGMMPLALTSNKWSMRKLKRNWKRLHYLTYPVAIFIVAHLLFLGEALPVAVLYSLLLGIRIPSIRKAITDWRIGRRKAQRAAIA